MEIDSSSGGEASAAEALAALLEQSHPYYTGDVPIDGWALTADGTDTQEFTNGNSTLHTVRLEVSGSEAWFIDQGMICA